MVMGGVTNGINTTHISQIMVILILDMEGLGVQDGEIDGITVIIGEDTDTLTIHITTLALTIHIIMACMVMDSQIGGINIVMDQVIIILAEDLVITILTVEGIQVLLLEEQIHL